jgi:hypothetical protein
MSKQTISAAYTLAPPESIVAPGQANQTVAEDFAPKSATYSDFYASAIPALAATREELNVQLTAWKEAVGDLEKAKETAHGVAEAGKGKSHMMSIEVSEDEDE